MYIYRHTSYTLYMCKHAINPHVRLLFRWLVYRSVGRRRRSDVSLSWFSKRAGKLRFHAPVSYFVYLCPLVTFIPFLSSFYRCSATAFSLLEIMKRKDWLSTAAIEQQYSLPFAWFLPEPVLELNTSASSV